MQLNPVDECPVCHQFVPLDELRDNGGVCLDCWDEPLDDEQYPRDDC